MALPAPIVQVVERHACFSGCFGAGWEIEACVDPATSLERLVYAQCEDCLAFKVGGLARVLGAGATAYRLALEITEHLRALRGYDLSISGYHAVGRGFWLSAAYYASCGVFLLNGDRTRPAVPDLDLLMTAFSTGVIKPPLSAMTDPRRYHQQVVYLNFAAPPPPIASRQDLLAAPQCSLTPRPGFTRATLAEFLPVAQTAPRVAPPALRPPRLPAPPARAAAPRLGDTCPVCGEQVRVRQLLTSTFVGCGC